MGHRGKDTISTKEDIVDLECCPLSNSQDMGRHLQAHLECLQHRLETIQSFGRPLLLPLLQDKFPAHLVDPPLGSQRNIFSRLQNRPRTEVPDARKKGRQGNKQPATDLAQRAGKKARGNFPELPNTTFMVVIRRVPNGNNDQTSSMQL